MATSSALKDLSVLAVARTKTSVGLDLRGPAAQVLFTWARSGGSTWREAVAVIAEKLESDPTPERLLALADVFGGHGVLDRWRYGTLFGLGGQRQLQALALILRDASAALLEATDAN